MTEEIEKRFNQIYDKLARLEQHVINLIIPIQQISSGTVYENLRKVMNQPLQIDDRGIRRLINDFVGNFDEFTKILKETNLKELSEAVAATNMAELCGMMKYQANRLKGIEMQLGQIEKNAKEKKVRVKVSIDGEEDQGESVELKTERALDCLNEREIVLFKYRTKWMLGAYTFKEIGIKLGFSTEKISMAYKKILRKLIAKRKIGNLKEVMPEESFALLRQHLGTQYVSTIA